MCSTQSEYSLFPNFISFQRHPFFAPVDWGRLLAKEIEPPFKPRLLSHEDPKYFPAEVKREPVFSDDGEGPDAAFGSGTVRDAAARMQRSRTPNRRAAVDSSSCGGDSGKISSSSRTRPAANCAADGNCVARAASGTGGHTEDACTNERPHACSSLSSHDSQNTEEDEGDALFKGFSYDERLQGFVCPSHQKFNQASSTLLAVTLSHRSLFTCEIRRAQYANSCSL